MKKLFKQADKIAKNVQNRINTKGAYEDAGQREITLFMDKVRASDIHYSDQCTISEYINRLIDNLKY